MFSKVLIANRGEIACRIIQTLDRLGIGSVAVYSEADVYARHVSLASEAHGIGAAPVNESYLNQDRILEVARASGVEAIHPGYGLLSENPEFARRCEEAGIAFIGPTPGQIRSFALKHEVRRMAEEEGVPLLPGSGVLAEIESARATANEIGYPVILKSTAGGGGIGMKICQDEKVLDEAFESVSRLAQSNFDDSSVFLEKYLMRARHVEVQIFGDGEGRAVALGDRDCSAQRRNQKVIEETPAPNLSEDQHRELADCATRLVSAANYRSAGTVEFLYDPDSEQFYLLEVNTRLQVEHGVTEAVSGVDLVEWMVRLSSGDASFLDAFVFEPHGHAVEARIYAENPLKDFQPAAGLLNHVHLPSSVRCDHWIETGTEVSPYYDPLLAKLVAHGSDRSEAIDKMIAALEETEIYGIATNVDYLKTIAAAPAFAAGEVHTRMLESLDFCPAAVEVLAPGTLTTIHDLGRLGYWNVGIPPSGPMDSLAFRIANRLVGNDEQAAGLELTVKGPSLRFHQETTVAIGGADMIPELDGKAVPLWESLVVPAGGTLTFGQIGETGCRSYLAVAGGFDVPLYLGSRSTFRLGQFGGHGGRALRAGDWLGLGESPSPPPPAASAPRELVPSYSREWEMQVIYGPHGAPDFFTDADIEMFFATSWEVHYNSDRTGVRLIGPKPEWARADGGEAGLHPSNIHDNAYAVGTVDFTGDMPVILGPDGPSLGGFVCPATIIQADLWKLGQVKAGDRIRFVPVTLQQANQQELATDRAIASLGALPGPTSARNSTLPTPGGVLLELLENGEHPAISYRVSGDHYLLIEYGVLALDFDLRFRVHAMMQFLEENPFPGCIDLTPGIRSLQIHYDSKVISTEMLLQILTSAEKKLPSTEELEVPSRIVHLPLSWDDPATKLAIEKYAQSVRSDAPWCPSNIEFIRRINGLDSQEAVREIVFNASYLVLGLGDVYLGAPVATPIDPRHRLVTTKYNPARTWTPENAVGIGGAYLCVYGMEGPGGYQFVGRTVQMWNRYHVTKEFPEGRPWLLRFFDQIRFHPVSSDELLSFREDFIRGRVGLEIEETTFKMRDYHAMLRANAESIDSFKRMQQQAFQEERQRWEANPWQPENEPPPDANGASERELAEGCDAIASEIAGSVWKLQCESGDAVEEGQTLAILEVMKMEIHISAPCSGMIESLHCGEGDMVHPGDHLFHFRANPET